MDKLKFYACLAMPMSIYATNLPLQEAWVAERTSGAQFDFRDAKAQIQEKDISGIWTGKQEYILGFIGDNYQRFQIHFSSIKKDPKNPFLYNVTGKTRVKSNVCDFSGTISVTKVEFYTGATLKSQSADFSPELQNAVKQRGILIARCVFDEDKSQKYTGRFEGTLISSFWIDHGDKILRDELSDATNFQNNEFVGEWTEYGKNNSKKCHWGEYRIPHSGDLDQGSSEFFPADKYLKNGWEDVATMGRAWWNNSWWEKTAK